MKHWWALALIAGGCARTPPTEDKASTDADADTDTDADADADTDADADSDADTDTDTDFDTVVRVMTWNIEGLGAVGSGEYEAAKRVIERIDPDVLGINEVDSADLGPLDSLAADLGYDTVVVSSSNPFGSIRNAMLTRLPSAAPTIWTTPMITADNGASDVTRYPISVEVTAPNGETIAVIVQHWKSGFDDIDEFRRAVDATRTAQAVVMANTDHYIALGDVNAELEDDGDSPSVFYSIPDPFSLPGGWELGSDLEAQLSSGIANHAFEPFTDRGLEPMDALQLDGTDGTRTSGRRIDYIFLSEGLGGAAEVYDSRDEVIGGGLPKPGVEPNRNDSVDAADHFAVFADIEL